MKILRFGISDDTHGNLPTAARSWSVSQARLAEASGLPWETVIRRSWPSNSFVREVGDALESEGPDLVMLCCAAFWVQYPSSPLKLHRSNLPGSQKLAKAAFWAASRPALANRALFHAGRRAVTRRSSAEFFFDPEVALERTGQAIRAILQHEQVALAVRGPLPLHIAGSEAFRAVCEARRAALNAGLARLCESLHVEFVGYGPGDGHPASEALGDRVHVNARGHARRAESEFDVMWRAWRAHRAASGD